MRLPECYSSFWEMFGDWFPVIAVIAIIVLGLFFAVDGPEYP